MKSNKANKMDDANIAERMNSRRYNSVMMKIGDAMSSVMDIKSAFASKEFRSSRTPEICDEIIKLLVDMMQNESTCGVDDPSPIEKWDTGSIGYALAP